MTEAPHSGWKDPPFPVITNLFILISGMLQPPPPPPPPPLHLIFIATKLLLVTQNHTAMLAFPYTLPTAMNVHSHFALLESFPLSSMHS